MRHCDFPAVHSLPLLREAGAATVDELLKDAVLQRFHKQQTVIKEGETPQFLHILIEGMVEFFANHNDQETTIDVVKGSVPLALVAAACDTMSLYSARTIAPSVMVLFRADAIRAASAHDADFAQAVLNEIALRYHGSIRALKNMKLRTSAERVANWILQAVNTGNGERFELECDKRTVASRLGMTPENFSRNLALLTKYGVRKSGRDILIDNPIALAQFAKPNQLLDG